MQYLTLRLLATLSFLATGSLSADLPLAPDSERRPGVPEGKIEKFTWTSRIFPGTVRDYWVYIPAQYKPETPAAVMVFQDGGGFVNDKGRFRVPIVFDNLIQKGDMPVTIAILINPGTLPALGSTAKPRDNRSYEYDSLGDRYARFLIEEILPEVGKRWNLTSDPNLRALAGNSSGGICSFNVAWECPDQFRRVLSTVGSFTDLRGGDIYPSLVRKMEPKPIRVYLQDNDHDLNIFAGDWPLANQQLVSALAYAPTPCAGCGATGRSRSSSAFRPPVTPTAEPCWPIPPAAGPSPPTRNRLPSRICNPPPTDRCSSSRTTAAAGSGPIRCNRTAAWPMASRSTASRRRMNPRRPAPES
jgi:enterochelin esterase family protein